MPIHRTCADAIRAFLRTGTLWSDECSCPMAWHEATGWHMVGCQWAVAS